MTKNIKSKTNAQFVHDLMDYDAMTQLFVIDALTKWSDKISQLTVKDFPDDGFINPEAWIHTAKKVRKAMDEKYGK